MDGLLDKISSYNIFNYLLPGSIFAVVADALTSFRVLQEDIVVGLFSIISSGWSSVASALWSLSRA